MGRKQSHYPGMGNEWDELKGTHSYTLLDMYNDTQPSVNDQIQAKTSCQSRVTGQIQDVDQNRQYSMFISPGPT